MDEAQARRLAGELHDGPIQELTVARMRLDLLRRQSDDTALVAELEALVGALDVTADGLRALMDALLRQP